MYAIRDGWYLSLIQISDQPERQITAEIIREKALRNLNDEIPHGIAVAIDIMLSLIHIFELSYRRQKKEF